MFSFTHPRVVLRPGESLSLVSNITCGSVFRRGLAQSVLAALKPGGCPGHYVPGHLSPAHSTLRCPYGQRPESFPLMSSAALSVAFGPVPAGLGDCWSRRPAFAAAARWPLNWRERLLLPTDFGRKGRVLGAFGGRPPAFDAAR